MIIRPRRSVLYMPGSNARAIEKARTLPVDGIILDLEDAVAPDAKAAAREQVVKAVKAGGFGRREVFVRINALDTPWSIDDLTAAALAGPDAILVPKVTTTRATRADWSTAARHEGRSQGPHLGHDRDAACALQHSDAGGRGARFRDRGLRAS